MTNSVFLSSPTKAILCKNNAKNQNCILAYSGLKQRHGKVIFSSYSNRAGVLLHAEQKLIIKRLTQRHDHFMSPQLLSSQIAEMESFENDIPMLKLNTVESAEELLTQVESF